MCRDLLNDAIRANALMIEFLHRSLGLYVACVKPAKVAWVKVGNILAAVLSRRPVTSLSNLELVFEIPVKRIE